MHLHHNLVVALLSDLFGIQARGGCSCAGPYGHRLLGIDLERSHEFEREISHGCEGIKPGWVRVNFNYFISEPVFRYVVEAVGLLADHGWSLIYDYRFDAVTGLWRHHDGARRAAAAPGPISAIDEDGTLSYPHTRVTAPEAALQHYLDEARALFAERARSFVDGADGAVRGVSGLRGAALVRAAVGLSRRRLTVRRRSGRARGEPGHAPAPLRGDDRPPSGSRASRVGGRAGRPRRSPRSGSGRAGTEATRPSRGRVAAPRPAAAPSAAAAYPIAWVARQFVTRLVHDAGGVVGLVRQGEQRVDGGRRPLVAGVVEGPGGSARPLERRTGRRARRDVRVRRSRPAARRSRASGRSAARGSRSRRTGPRRGAGGGSISAPQKVWQSTATSRPAIADTTGARRALGARCRPTTAR